MATDLLANAEPATTGYARPGVSGGKSRATTLRKLLMPLASLKLTVTLLAMAIFIVLAGTLAQVDKDIWQVVDVYFRSAFAWIDFQLFFPRSISVPGGIYFPGGWLIGAVMAANLVAAHGLRFKTHARGARLAAGLAVVTVGCALTWAVIASGFLGGQPIEGAAGSWSTLWILLKLGLTVVWLGGAYALFAIDSGVAVVRYVLGAVMLGVGALLVWLWIDPNAMLDPSGMRILWQLIKGTAAGIVLLAGCWLLFDKRAGIVLLHAGIGLIMFNELLVGRYAVEAQMHIREGESVDFVQDIRAMELAVIDPSDAKHDRVVAIPQSLLTREGVIRHEALPFDVQVVKYLQNSEHRPRQSSESSPATAGAGLEYTVDERRPGVGTDTEGEVDMSAAYVKLFKKGTNEPLGTYLVGLFLSLHDYVEEVTVDGKPYQLAMRFKRTYKPYSVHLIDFHHDRYLGTDTPKNFASDVRLVDTRNSVDREVKIWMNNPLRYEGETFYQQSWLKDPKTGEDNGTVLQVVSNANWMIPYVACMIVATGMLTQFSLTLARFLRRRSALEVSAAAPAKVERRTRRNGATGSPAELVGRWLPWLVVAGGAAFVGSQAMIPRTPDGEMRLYDFGKLPLAYEGRVKPFDTLARNSLQVISGKQSFVDESSTTQPAIRWLLDVISNSDAALKHKVFRIDNAELLQTLGLEARKGFRYAIAEFDSKIAHVGKEADAAREAGAERASSYQRKVLDLEQKLKLYLHLAGAFEPPPLRADHLAEDIRDFRRFIDRKEKVTQPPRPVPPRADGNEWQSYPAAFTAAVEAVRLRGQSADPATMAISELLAAYRKGDTKAFNQSLADYEAVLANMDSGTLQTGRATFEAFFNHSAPFFCAALLYFIAFVLAALAWLGWTRPLSRAAFWLILLAWGLHTVALVGRIYISGRPPVTNLYSAAVFIGWGGVLIGLVLEMVYKLGIGNVIASVAGFATLQIAHQLSGDGVDTFKVLQAVLDTQFWLATHVTCITTGYATTYIAGLLGLIYVLRGVFTPSLSPALGKDLARMIYGTLCFAMFFSFVGTVLGGLWADDSWGRFWGWDPKENGALLIVLWNALVLHARWDGMVKDRGLAVLAVGGNITTSWSFFGVNELGKGLHTYGFTEGVALTLALFVVSQLAVVALGCIPLSRWRSFRRDDAQLATAV